MACPHSTRIYRSTDKKGTVFYHDLLKSSTSYVYKPLQLQGQCLHGLLQSLDTYVFGNGPTTNGLSEH